MKNKLDNLFFDGTMSEALQGMIMQSLPNNSRKVLEFFRAARSSTEGNWLASGHIPLIETLGWGKVYYYGYEWVSFKLPGGLYTPDYFYCTEGGLLFVEIKGTSAQANYRDARSKLRAAAALNPWAVFFEAKPNRTAWDMEKINPDSEFLKAMARYASG